MKKTPFDQNNFLDATEEGVCNALTIMWLAGNGVKLSITKGGRGKKKMDQARLVHGRGGILAQARDGYGMDVADAEDIAIQGGLAAVNTARQTREYVAKTQGLYFIGSSGGPAGKDHAIGVINDSRGYRGFDPSECYVEFDNITEMDVWVTGQVLEAALNLCREILVIRFELRPIDYRFMFPDHS